MATQADKIMSINRISQKSRAFIIACICAVSAIIIGSFLLTRLAQATCSGGSTMCVDSVTPSSGALAGGTTIRIEGDNLAYPTPYSDGTDSYFLQDHLEFTGTQYIDTGVWYLLGDDSIKMEMDAEYTAITGPEQLTGFRSMTGYTWRFFFSMYPGGSPVSAHQWSSVNQGTQTGITLEPISTARKIQAMEYDRNTTLHTAWLNNTLKGTRTTSAPDRDIGPVHIGQVMDVQGYELPSKFKIYNYKFWIDGELVRDFQPVQNTRTGECGLLDTVNNQFYGNDGSGTFGCATSLDITEVEIDIDGTLEQCVITDATKTYIDCIVPVGTIGAKDVIITKGSEIVTLTGGYTYRPVVTGVETPQPDGPGVGNVGSTSGGNTLTINGSGFMAGATVTVGIDIDGSGPDGSTLIMCENITVVSDTELTCQIPNSSLPEGLAKVYVFVDGIWSLVGTSALVAGVENTYYFRAPLITPGPVVPGVPNTGI